jgi:2-methylfumaryl-CoA isomerase
LQALLSGMRVVEGSAFIAAPSGGMTLAQLGADVIRFDQIGGGIDYRRWPVTDKGKSLYWHSLNKGKRSFAVDFRKPEGKELITQLICADGEDAGIFLTNFPAKGWLADATLRARRKDLIYLNLTGDRHGGSALDYTVNSKVGLPFLSGDGENPRNSPFPAWDVIAGQHIALGLLTAERHRRIHGQGRLVRLALADVALATMGHLGYLAEAEVNKEPRASVGNHVFGSFGHDFKCSDGERVMIVGVSPNQWKAILRVTETHAQVAELEASLNLDFSNEGDRFRDSHAVHQALDQASVCWGPYQTIQQLVQTDSDCSVDNPLFEKVEQPGIGEYLMPSSPLNFEGLENVPVTPAPALGQHTDEILGDTLGLSGGEIGKLHDSGVVAGPST